MRKRIEAVDVRTKELSKKLDELHAVADEVRYSYFDPDELSLLKTGNTCRKIYVSSKISAEKRLKFRQNRVHSDVSGFPRFRDNDGACLRRPNSTFHICLVLLVLSLCLSGYTYVHIMFCLLLTSHPRQHMPL